MERKVRDFESESVKDSFALTGRGLDFFDSLKCRVGDGKVNGLELRDVVPGGRMSEIEWFYEACKRLSDHIGEHGNEDMGSSARLFSNINRTNFKHSGFDGSEGVFDLG